MFLSKNKQKDIKIENNYEYNYILEWSKRNVLVNDLKSLYDFIFRKYSDEELNKFGVEPLKVAWNSLSNAEQIVLTSELAVVYRNRIK